jgi:hypothetical protein
VDVWTTGAIGGKNSNSSEQSLLSQCQRCDECRAMKITHQLEL